MNLAKIHWEAAKHILSYVKGTKELKLTYGTGSPGIYCYSDTDWASQEDWHLISRYVLMVDRGSIAWSSKKQPIVALLMTEAKFIAAMQAGREIRFIRNLIEEIF